MNEYVVGVGWKLEYVGVVGCEYGCDVRVGES